jgi:hypothetical protein
MAVRWVTTMIDLPAVPFDAATAFWAAVAGATVSPARGPAGEFRTLVPASGDAVLGAQRLADGPARVHLALHTDDQTGLADHAVRLGATLLDDSRGHASYPSPHGLAFCVVTGAPGDPLRFLLQRCGVDGGSDEWTTLRDPAGLEFCVTDRDPGTGPGDVSTLEPGGNRA